MNERPPSFGQVGPERERTQFEDLPILYQNLGKACADAGILDDFHALVEAGYEYGQALSSLRPKLIEELQLHSTDDIYEWFRKFELIYEVDDEPVSDDSFKEW